MVYDQGLTGLAATYWANSTMAGSPYAHDTTAGANWGAGVPVAGLPAGGWSARFTGTGPVPTLSIDFAGYLRAYVNDRLVMDWWSDNPAGTRSVYVGVTASPRVRIDYRPGSAGARMIVAGASFSPRYGLVTTTTTRIGSPAEGSVVSR